MALTIPDQAEAPTSVIQSRLFQSTIDALVAGYERTGVVSGCAVSAQGSPDMTVAVASGTVEVAGVQVAVSSGNLTIGAADITNPRIDLITADSSGTKAVVAGTAAASPLEPALPASKALLAVVLVPAAVTTIVTNYITDRRVVLNDGHVRLTTNQTVAGQKTFTDLLRITKTYTDVPSGLTRLALSTITARGTQTVSDRRTAIGGLVIDDAGVVGDKSVTNAVDNGGGLIRLTVTGHTITDGDGVAVWGVGGVTNANGVWVADVIDANTIDLLASTFAGAYTSGGSITNRPMMTAVSAVVAPAVARGGITGAGINGDDVNGVVVFNLGTAKATEAVYVGDNSAISGYQWLSQFTANAESQVGFLVGNTGDVDEAFALAGAIKASGYGIDLYSGASTVATWGAGAQAIRLPNARGIVARNAAASADLPLVTLDASNYLVLGATTPVKVATSDGHVAIGTDPSTQPLLIKSDSSTAFRATRDSNSVTFEMDAYAAVGVPSFTGRRSMGTEAAKTQVTVNEDLARFGGAGYHSGSAFSVARGYMAVRATESWTSTANGSKIVFLTTAATTTTTTLRFTIDENGLTFADALNIVFNATTGTKIGTGATQKLAFWNATPIVQPAAYTQTFATADRTHAARTATTLTDNTAGTPTTTLEALGGAVYATDVAAIRNNFADLAAAVNAIIVDLADTASVVNSLVDDHQAVGLCA